MHSKFLKVQTVFLTLAVLFTSVLVPNQVQALESGSASNAAQTAAITDPNTFNAWYEIQGNNTSAIGRIWADKTVDADPIQFTTGPLKGQSVKKSAGSDFLVALSAMSSTSSTTQTEPIPLDVVMVLDASGSMSDPMSGTDATKRIDALKKAVSKFIEKAADKNAQISDKDKKIRLSIVKFAGKTSNNIGNDTYRDGRYTYNYSQIMQNLTVCEGSDAAQLKDAVDHINPSGATRADYGLERAQAALASNPDPARSNAKKVVIFFTDGSPTSSNGFESEVAASAIATAKDIKAAGTEVYTVGIFGGANPSADVSNSGTSLANKFMHAVSSNYPEATYSYKSHGLFGGSYDWTFGTKAAGANYYLAASSADGLNTVFENIFRSVSTNLTGPTHIEEGSNPSSDGYVTFDDTLGSFMEVKGFNGIALADRIYTNIQKTTNGNVDTYECTDQVTGPVSPAYPQHADLSKVLITVTHSDDRKTGDSVRVRIPASMLPLRHFDLQRDAGGNVTSLNVTDTYPIRVLYSVGLKNEVRSDLEAGTSTDPDLVQYVAANAVDGEIHFYSNAYTGKKNSEGITIGDTTASFVPALNNSFYYYTQDTPLYMDSACTKPVTDFQKGQTYYYKLEYYSNQAGQTTPTYGFNAIPISISADQDGSVIGKDANGQAYVQKGTKKGSMPRAIDDQIGDKTENITETATRRIDYDWNLKNGFGYLHLGNNGRLGYEAKGSLKITKQVQAADGLTPAADTAFTMQVDLTNAAGTALPGSYGYTVDGTAAGKITSGGTITLNNGQTAEIEGLPAGAKYAVSEVNVPAWYKAAISDSGNGVITAGRVNDTAPVVTVTNTYAPAAYSMENAFPGSKTLNGRNWKDGDSYRFLLEAINPTDAPLPATVETDAAGTRYSQIDVTAADGTPAGTPINFNFGTVTFTKPGKYVYNIREYTPSTEDRIPGVSYDETVYRATVVITDNGQGQLALGSYTLEEIVQENGTTNAPNGNVAAFTNTFNANDEVINFKALKRYVDHSGATRLADGQFHFTLERAATDDLNQPVATQAPMPSAEGCNATNTAGGAITFGNITYGTADIGKTYWYTIKEVPGSEPNMVYSNAEYLAKVDVTLKNTDTYAGISYFVKQADGSWNPLEGSGDNTPVVFENTYTPTAASATLQLTKTLTGRDWADSDAFTFTLTGEGNAPMPAGDAAVTVSGSTEGHKAAFGAITYQQVGTYRYTITEQATNIRGVAIDTPVTATVTVSYENGALKAAVAYSRGTDSAAFTNTYTAAPTDDVTLTARKTLNVESGSWALQGNDFSFALYDNADCTGTPLRTASNTADGSITFGALTFDAAGEYTYYMREVPGDRTAITYDSTVYKVTITVEDHGTGVLTALPPVYTLNDEAMGAAKFVNTYTATPGDDTFTLTANKLLNGRAMNAGEFSFELTDSTGAVVSTGTNAADGTVTFSPVGLKAAQEQYSAFLASLPAAVEPEATATPEPTATPEATAVPEATPEATAEPEPTATPEVTAQPEATAEPDPTTEPETTPAPEASALPQADGMAAAPMSLVVAPLAAGTQEIQPDFGPDDGIAPDLMQRWYTITEVNTGKTGVTYDSTVYKVLVPLKDSGDGSGTLVVDDEHIQYYRVVDGELAPVDGVTFTNSYAPLSTSVTLGGTKKLNGRALAADEFTFELCSADGTKVLSTAANQANGRFSFASLVFDAEGTYTYTVREKNTGAARVTYDQTVYKVTVKVVNKNGQLTAEVALPDGGLTFTNSYAPLPTSVTLEGSKKLNGRALAADEFTFELCSADGTKVLSTAANQANGRFSFASLVFDAEGTYTYTVREKNTGAARVTYDQTVYKVTVKVVNKNGQLTAEVALPDGGLTFTNTYTPEPTPTPSATPKPDHKDKPKQTPAPTSTAQPAAPTQSPRTGDNASLMTWVGLLLVCGTALAGLYVYKKRKQK